MSGFQLEIDRDENKAIANRAKHGVAFKLAATVFSDPQAQTMFDADHSSSEERWITRRRDESGSLLVIVHTWNQETWGDAKARLIEDNPL